MQKDSETRTVPFTGEGRMPHEVPKGGVLEKERRFSEEHRGFGRHSTV